ncbi:hypothetical protein TB9_23510, partial [Xanthomonas perforans]
AGHAKNLRSYKHQELGLLLAASALLEEISQERNISKERNFGDAFAIGKFIDTTNDYCLTVAY